MSAQELKISAKEFQQRRQAFLAQLPANSIAVLSAGSEKIRKGDTNYFFTPHSDFYYLTGFAEADAVAIFVSGASNGEFVLFNQADDPAKTIWVGKRVGQEGAVRDYGARYAYPLESLEAFLQDFTQEYPDNTLLFHQADNELAQKLQEWEIELPMAEVSQYIAELRLIKSPAEIQLMQKAADISSQAHRQLLSQCKPGMYEYQLEAEYLYYCQHHGARFQSYNPIFASGANACVLHYDASDQKLKAGDLLLVDAGCEFEHYASDVTRTIPVSGKFSSEQKAIYELVLQTQLAIIAMIKPGVDMGQLQAKTIHLLTTGLVALGLLHGDVDSLIADKAHLPYFMHGVSHWLGLDVHDVGGKKIGDKFRELAPGYVLTVEPGIYIAPDNVDVPVQWRGIGIRIEDDVLVTKDGSQVLSSAPKTVADIESLMAL